MRNQQLTTISITVPKNLGAYLAVLIALIGTFLIQPFSSPVFAVPPPPNRPYSVYLPLTNNADSSTASQPSGPDWLVQVNQYRSLANLPPVAENPAWSRGDENHARYVVKNDILIHDEDEKNPWYSREGKEAAQSGNLMASGDPNASDDRAITSWMQAPFHALGILDPVLTQIGFGSFREADGGFQMGAALDVLRGLGGIPAGVQFPILWPANGAIMPLTTFYGEHPDPILSCPGYTSPSGIPLLLQLGAGDLTPNVTGFSLLQGGKPVESCAFSETSYKNPDADSQALGRAVLNDRDAVVLIPRSPLTPGAQYTASISVDGKTYTWSFTVAGKSALQTADQMFLLP